MCLFGISIQSFFFFFLLPGNFVQGYKTVFNFLTSMIEAVKGNNLSSFVISSSVTLTVICKEQNKNENGNFSSARRQTKYVLATGLTFC